MPHNTPHADRAFTKQATAPRHPPPHRPAVVPLLCAPLDLHRRARSIPWRLLILDAGAKINYQDISMMSSQHSLMLYMLRVHMVKIAAEYLLKLYYFFLVYNDEYVLILTFWYVHILIFLILYSLLCTYILHIEYYT